jgi:hypothetical protein
MALAPRSLQPTKRSHIMLGKIVDRVVWWGAAAWDAHWNNPTADEHLIQKIEQDPDVTAVWIEDPLTDIAKAEALNKDLTYWHLTLEEAMEEAARVPNSMRYQYLWGKQFDVVLRPRLEYIRKRLPHIREIVLSIDGKNNHQTMVALAHEILVQRRQNATAAVRTSREQMKERRRTRKGLAGELGQVQGQEGMEHRVGELEQQIRHEDSEIHTLESTLRDQEEEKQIYREKKGGPIHQAVTAQLVHELHARYQAICNEFNIVFKPAPGIHRFSGGFTVDYAMTRHPTWAVLKNPEKSLVKSTHGKMTAYQRNANRYLNELLGVAGEYKGDAFVEGSIHGKIYFGEQSNNNSAKQANFSCEGFKRDDGVESIYLVNIPPFEDKKRIGKYFSGEEPERTSASSKMTNTRNHPAFERYNKGSVTGVMVLTKLDTGIVYPEITQYQYFVDGTVHETVTEYAAIAASSDEHIGSKESDPMVRKGFIELIRWYAKNAFAFRGKPAWVRGFVTGGDTNEAVMTRWDRRDFYQPNPDTLIFENIERLTELVQKHHGDVTAAITEAAYTQTSDAMSMPHSMDMILDWGADYLDTIFKILAEFSLLQILSAGVSGNHADGVLRALGMKEYRPFLNRLIQRGYKVFEGNVPARYTCDQSDPEVRAAYGSRGDARILIVEGYGKKTDGGEHFKPQKLLIHHDPEGNDATGLINTTLTHEADVGLSGHTHVVYMVAFEIAPNEFRVVVRLPTAQGRTQTEIKYANVPRYTGCVFFFMPRPGDFALIILPARMLQKIADQAYKAFTDEQRQKLGEQDGRGY